MTVNLLEVNERVLLSLLADPRAADIVPTLRSVKSGLDRLVRGHPDCPKCEKKRKAERLKLVRDGLKAIISLRGDKLQQLKNILGASQLRVFVPASNGGRAKYTL